MQPASRFGMIGGMDSIIAIALAIGVGIGLRYWIEKSARSFAAGIGRGLRGR